MGSRGGLGVQRRSDRKGSRLEGSRLEGSRLEGSMGEAEGEVVEDLGVRSGEIWRSTCDESCDFK